MSVSFWIRFSSSWDITWSHFSSALYTAIFYHVFPLHSNCKGAESGQEAERGWEARWRAREKEREGARTRTSTISQCVNKLLFIDFQGETLLTCPALNGRHLLLALRLSLLLWRAARRALAMPSTACCSIVQRPIIQQLSATTFTMRLPFVGYRR